MIKYFGYFYFYSRKIPENTRYLYPVSKKNIPGGHGKTGFVT